MAFDDFDQRFGLERFEQELAGAAFYGVYGGSHIGIGGHQNEGHVGHLPAHGAQQPDAVEFRHSHVANDDGGCFGIEPCQCLDAIAREAMGDLMHSEREADGFAQRFVIFHDQNATGWWLGGDGGSGTHRSLVKGGLGSRRV